MRWRYTLRNRARYFDLDIDIESFSAGSYVASSVHSIGIQDLS